MGLSAIDRLRPRSTLYVHLSAEALQSSTGQAVTGRAPSPTPEVARVEGHGPVGLRELLSWLGSDRLTVRPVVDPWDQVDHTGTHPRGRNEPEILRQRRARIDVGWAA